MEPSAVDPVSAVAPTRLPEPAPTTDGHTTEQDPFTQATAGQNEPQTEGSVGGAVPQGNPPQTTQGQVTPGQLTAGSKPSTPWPQTASSGNSLLDAIINDLGKAQPGSQPTPTLAPTTGASGDLIYRESHMTSPTSTAGVEGDYSAGTGAAKSDPTTPGGVGTSPAQEGIAVGNTITLGSATLTLTPGLSTIIGTGSDTTLVAIQTDSASHTAITVSSSGTAVTATITNAPATITLPRTGFEASVTKSAGRGVSTPRPAVTASTTSSRGVANEQRTSIGGLTGLVLVLGLVLAS